MIILIADKLALSVAHARAAWALRGLTESENIAATATPHTWSLDRYYMRSDHHWETVGTNS